MARKNPLVKTPNAKAVYQSLNKDNELEYFVRFKPKGKNPFPIVNYTEVFNLHGLPQEEHLKKVEEWRDYTQKKWDNEGVYYIDEVNGKLEKEKKEKKKAKKAKKIAKLQAEEQKKFNSLFNTIFELDLANKTFTEQTRKSYISNYNKHVKPYFGSVSVYDIKFKDIEEAFKIMKDPERNGTGKHVYHKKSGKVIMHNKKKPLSFATKKNVLTIFRNVFKYLVDDDEEFADFYFNPASKMLNKLKEEFKQSKTDVSYPPLTHRVQLSTNKEMLNIMRKIYQEITKFDKQHLTPTGKPRRESGEYISKIFFFTSLMTARRISELQRVTRKMINFDTSTVFIPPEMTKNKKPDSYVLPPEAMEIIQTKDDEYPIKVSYGTSNRQWRKIKKAIGMENTELRHYDFRHLFVSIMTEYYDRHTLGLCISHSSGDDVKANEHYFSITFEKKKEIFEKYWELLRAPIEE